MNPYQTIKMEFDSDGELMRITSLYELGAKKPPLSTVFHCSPFICHRNHFRIDSHPLPTLLPHQNHSFGESRSETQESRMRALPKWLYARICMVQLLEEKIPSFVLKKLGFHSQPIYRFEVTYFRKFCAFSIPVGLQLTCNFNLMLFLFLCF